MTLKMQDAQFELEFDGVQEACEFINTFMRNNPNASLITMKDFEKQQMLNDAANDAADLLGIDREDPVLKKAVKIAKEFLGL